MLYGSLLFVYEVVKDERRIVTMTKCSFVTWNNNDSDNVMGPVTRDTSEATVRWSAPDCWAGRV